MGWIFAFIKTNVYDLSRVRSTIEHNLYLFTLPVLQRISQFTEDGFLVLLYRYCEAGCQYRIVDILIKEQHTICQQLPAVKSFSQIRPVL